MKKKVVPEKTANLKIAAIILSVLLWFYVSTQGQLTARNAAEIDLNYYSMADNLTVSGPDKVTVRLWGTLSETDAVEAFIDLKGLGPGSYDLPVILHQSNRALFSSVEPNRVQIVIKEIKENIFPIAARNTAVLPAGFQLADIFTVPASCSVQGNQSEVGKVATVIAPLSLASSPEIQSAAVVLQAVDKEGQKVEGIRIIPEKAVVYAIVSQSLTSRQIPVKPVFTGAPGEGCQRGQVIVEPQEAFLIAGQGSAEDATEIATEEIDLEGKTASFTAEVPLLAPEGARIYPERVSIYIEIKAADEVKTETGESQTGNENGRR